MKKLRGKKGTPSLALSTFLVLFSALYSSHTNLYGVSETGRLKIEMAGRLGQFPKFIKGQSGGLGQTRGRQLCSSIVRGVQRHIHPEGN